MMKKFEALKKDFLENLPPGKKELLSKVCYYSSCLCNFLFRHENYLDYFFDNLDKPLVGKDKLVEEAEKLLDLQNEKDFIQKLTEFKMKHFGRIVSKDIYRRNSLIDLMKEYSYLADATLEVAFKRAWDSSVKKFGVPLDENGNVSNASVIALGKLGGKELNYYSDIDVMYIYKEDGKTERGFTNREFYSYMFSKLTRLLTTRNTEGQTWIVDLDLRPNGKSGFIAYSLEALEVYYWTMGRTWERSMLIKARHSAGNKDVSDEFIKIITPFVYRKSITKEELKEIVEIKNLIQQDAEKYRKDEFDVKKGKGGIRSIEFTAQILQLLYGGKYPQLRERSTYKAIQELKTLGILKENEAQILSDAYLFYRNLEHTIQIENCQQTQIFKYSKAEEYAKKLGFKSGEQLIKTLNSYRNQVEKIFNSLSLEEAKELTPLQKYILTKHYEDEALNYISKIGFKDPKWALERIKEIFFSKEFIILSVDFKEALFDFIPELEKQLKTFPDREDFLLNLNKLLLDGKMLPIFASALVQNKKLVEFILNIAKLSDYITNLMAKDPKLLDFAFGVEDILITFDDFEKELSLIKGETLEERLNELKNVVYVLTTLKYLTKIEEKSREERVDLLNKILTNLADFILGKLYEKYTSKGLAVYGLGKLGSKEMNIGSDLDIVFVFDNTQNKEKYKDTPQKIVKSLTSYTKYGILYPIDLRLRPYGRSGELAPTLKYYGEYFQKEARPWEKMAWTKARFITGDKEVAKQMDRLIDDFLFSTPITKEFLHDVYEMRLKLEGLASERPDEIDIKLGYGGIVDLEFIAQLKILKEKEWQRSIKEVIKKYYPELLNHYLFLREIETLLRMVKGNSISKIKKNSPFLNRIAHVINTSPDTLWNKLIDTKKQVRKSFLREYSIKKN